MRYLLLMTAAGSILFMLYGIWTIICGRYLNHGMKYAVLKIVLLVHVIPLIGLKIIYTALLESLSSKQAVPQSDLLVAMADISTASEDYMTPDFKWSILFAAILAGITVLILLCICTVYLRKRRALSKVSGSCHSETGARIVEKLKPRYRIKRPIEVIQLSGKRTPYTMGVFRPIIVLHGEFDESEMECALKHELTHIARGDVFLKLFLGLVRSLYWFNPVLYVYKYFYDKECESSCDERVISECTKAERDAYAGLLMKYMQKEQGKAMSTALAEDYDNIEDRINEIMNIRKMKRWQKIVAISIFTVFMLADSFVALAYPNVYHVEDEQDKFVTATDVVVADNSWAHTDGCKNHVYEVLYDAEFIDEAGTITPVNTIQPNVFCITHNKVFGYSQLHIKDGNGGCAIELYDSYLCTRCNTIKIEAWHNTITYAKCPH